MIANQQNTSTRPLKDLKTGEKISFDEDENEKNNTSNSSYSKDEPSVIMRGRKYINPDAFMTSYIQEGFFSNRVSNSNYGIIRIEKKNDKNVDSEQLEEEVNDMNNDLFIKLIESLEKNNERVKSDSVESEKRIASAIERMEDRSRQMEHRIINDRKESEERLAKLYEQSNLSMREFENRISEDLRETRNDSKQTQRWVTGSVVALVISVMIFMWQIFQASTQ